MLRRISLSFICACIAFSANAENKTAVEDHIDIFTTTKAAKRYSISRLKMLSGMKVNIHYVDAIDNFNNFFGGEIRFTREVNNQDVKKLQAQIQKKMNSAEGLKAKQDLKKGVESFQKAKRLGIEKIPAVVFEDKYIIYGEKPLKAFSIYRRKTG